MINVERNNNQLSHGKFKRFLTYFSCMLVLKLYIHHNAQFSLKKLYTYLSFSVDS